MLGILVGVGLVTFIYIALIKPFNHWKDLGVTQRPFWITWKEIFIGFAKPKPVTDMVKNVYNCFPKNRYYGTYQFFRPLLILRDIDLIKQVTVKDFDHFVDHIQFIPDNIEPLWNKNLVALKGDKWRDMRATLSPSFTSSKMKMMFGLISECAKQFAKYFEDEDLETVTVEMKDAFTRFTNDVIASSAFGVSCDSMRDRNNSFYLMGKEVMNFGGFWKTVKFFVTILSPKFARILGLSWFDETIKNFFKNLVIDNIQAREEKGIIRPDMIHLLMEARKERSKNDKVTEDVMDMGFATVDESTTVKEERRKKEQITDDDIVAQAFIFFLAGFETVSTLMCFMSHELAVNPEIQERLQNEIDDTLNDCNGSLTYEALSKMKYMDMVISESLRKWPSAIVMDRACVKPYVISPLKEGENPLYLKEGSMVWIPVFGIHRDPKLYPEPERFDPERFSDENKMSIAPCSYLPFGTGPRSCIGNRFALMETKLVFFHILNKFDITVVEKTTVPLKLSNTPFQLVAEGGFWLGLKARKIVA